MPKVEKPPESRGKGSKRASPTYGCNFVCGEWQNILPSLPKASFDCVVTDPPVAERDMTYGRISAESWLAMMKALLPSLKPLLKPTGSCVFLIQPNSERAGRMRPWLWDFMSWACHNLGDWGIVQDVYWWDCAAMPKGGANSKGLLRNSVRTCVWLGPYDCYRNQSAVKWRKADTDKAVRQVQRATHGLPLSDPEELTNALGCCSLHSFEGEAGVVPFNLLPIPAGVGPTSNGDATAWSVRTPSSALCDWWVKYICPQKGRVLDPFSGSGTVVFSALNQGKTGLGIEMIEEYHNSATGRLKRLTASASP